MYGASKVLISTINVLLLNGFKVHLMLPNHGPLNNHQSIKKVKLSNKGKFLALIHLAAKPGVRESILNPQIYFDNNLDKLV